MTAGWDLSGVRWLDVFGDVDEALALTVGEEPVIEEGIGTVLSCRC